tara:strand:+ start:19 stop:783 length:765 start_codon:yes stop_codon:yes gene_type:complete
VINKFKNKLDNNNITFGPFIGIPSVSTAELMGWMGFDFVIIDCEHGPMDFETVENMIRASELSGITPIIRIGLNEQQHIQRYLDSGAKGVMIPLINTRNEAKSVVDSVKYPPIGKRGVFGNRGSKFGLIPTAEQIKLSNKEIFVSVQIETKQSVKNQDEIIKTEGIDAIFLGPGDLSVSLGVPGEMMHNKVIETMNPIVENALKNGKHVGTLGLDLDQAKYWHNKGVNWLVASSQRFLISGTKNYIDNVKKPLI